MSEMGVWTYSQLDTFEQCARQYHAKYVVKRFPFVETDATRWGNRVHAAFEAVFTDGTPLPEGMTQWQKLVNKFAAIPGVKKVEQKIAIDRNFQAADYWKSWSRGKIDLTIVNGSEAVLADWKSGKYKATEQLMLYAGYAFANGPQLKKVQTVFAWLRDRKLETKSFTRDQLPVIWQEFVPRVRRLELAYERDIWPAKPSGLCKGWCPVTDCEHYQNKA